MTRPIIPLLFIICGIIFAAFISTYTDDTEIYSIEDVTGQGNFFNPISLRLISQEQTENTVSTMEEFFGSQNTVVLNIRLKNFEDAERDLEEYRRAVSSFNNLIIKLDMSKSEVAEFQKENKEQLQRLEETLNNSKAYEELSKLTLQYQDDEGSIYSLTYEGERIKERMRELAGEYTESYERMDEIANHLEINTTEGATSVSALQNIVDEIDTEQQELVRTASDLQQQSVRTETGTSAGSSIEQMAPDTTGILSLTLRPDIVTYGDILTATGSYQDIPLPGSRTVYLMIDTRAYTAFYPREDGTFSIPVSAGDITSGQHRAYVHSGTDSSPARAFSVTDAPATLSLSAERIPNGIAVNGTLIARNLYPVGGAAIQIYRDDQLVEQTKTNASGFYQIAFTDDGEAHTIQAFFSETAIPVADCESLPVEVPATDEIPILFLVLALVLLVGSGSLLMKGKAGPLRDVMKTNGFFNGKKTEELEEPPKEREPKDSGNELTKKSPNQHPPSQQRSSFIEGIEADFREAFRDGRHTEAARLLSDALFITAGNARGIRLPTTLTVRERAKLLGDEDEKVLRPFLILFEETVYGEKELTREKAATLFAGWRTIMNQYGAAS